MSRFLLCAACFLLVATSAQATVFINEVYINPPGSSYDETREFIELLGTPGMKLDGYAVAFVNGAQQKYYTLGSLPPVPADHQEIDEFFSLDGLQLGPNGILVIGIGVSAAYPTLLPDTNFQRWNVLWNGGYDTTGKLNNDGSNTVMLIRNRPGATEAQPSADVRWGKDVIPDYELFTPVTDPQDGIDKDQFGDGNLDKGQPSGGLGITSPGNLDPNNTLDVKGASTVADISDDLEVVDEVSYEHDRGWEYDLDDRHVDDGSTHNGPALSTCACSRRPTGLQPRRPQPRRLSHDGRRLDTRAGRSRRNAERQQLAGHRHRTVAPRRGADRQRRPGFEPTVLL